MLFLLAWLLPVLVASAREINNQQVWLSHGKEFYPVVGAKDKSAIILLQDGSTKTVSFRKWKILEKQLPCPGTIRILSSTPQRGLPRKGIPGSTRIEFITDQDYENLYAVMFVRVKGSRSIKQIGFREIGPVKAGEVYKKALELSFSRVYQGELNWKYTFVEFVFYSNGLQLEKRRR